MKDSDEDSLILDYEPDEPELLSHEDTNDTNDSIVSKTSACPSSSDVLEEARKEIKELKAEVPEKSETKKVSYKKAEKTVQCEVIRRLKDPKEQLNSKVVFVKSYMIDSDDDHEPSKAEYVKCATPRNYGGAAFQANKLVLKALFRPDSSVKSYSSNKGRTICLRNLLVICDRNGSSSMEYKQQARSEVLFPVIEEIRPKSPHFIVTLEGVSINSSERKMEKNIESIEDDDDFMESDPFAEDTSPNQKAKTSERCKYWPACKHSANCPYVHPTVLCKCFPDCKYGDKCLYIHPKCKFEASCSRKHCPFTHASRFKSPWTTVTARIPINPRRGQVVCRYYPNCTTRHCAFIHPKLFR